MGTYKRLPVAFTSGSGSWLVDRDGNRYLDALSGISVCSLGHANPALATGGTGDVLTGPGIQRDELLRAPGGVDVRHHVVVGNVVQIGRDD